MLGRTQRKTGQMRADDPVEKFTHAVPISPQKQTVHPAANHPAFQVL